MSLSLSRFEMPVVISDKDPRFLPLGPDQVEHGLINSITWFNLILSTSDIFNLRKSLVLLEPQYLQVGLERLNACLVFRIE